VRRDELLVQLSAQVLALPEDGVATVALDGMSCVGKTTLALEIAEVVTGAGRPVLPVSYDDFHHERERRHRSHRFSPEGYLRDSYDPALLRRLVLDPAATGRPVVPAAYDLATESAVPPQPVELAAGSVVLVEGEFLLGADVGGRWDLGVLLVAEPAAVLARAVRRDAGPGGLGDEETVRSLYLRRYLAAWSLYEERHDPWSRADVVVDLTDPLAPRVLSG
jgi:uridine kinase